jgi:hypothetical protein
MAVGGMFDDKAVAAQPIAQAPRQFGIVLDQKNADDCLLANPQKGTGNVNASRECAENRRSRRSGSRQPRASLV